MRRLERASGSPSLTVAYNDHRDSSGTQPRRSEPAELIVFHLSPPSASGSLDRTCIWQGSRLFFRGHAHTLLP